MICGRSPCYRLAQGLGHAHPTQRLIKFSLHIDSPLKFDPAYSILSAHPELPFSLSQAEQFYAFPASFTAL
ncbi:hypothetical protein [uncultured Campylobacter sp.]|uniref:hypothetical protein n=1 Tax=uncultured Campylobacter sp. TaxID=218934 RepID=UPI0026294960|nr:hypothetical protein [uncultured Campylobacter sp.]